MRLSFRVASVVAGLAFVLPSIAQTRLSIGGTHEETFRQGRISYIQRHEQSGKKYLAQYELTYTAGAFRWLRRFVEPSSAIEKESIFVVHPDFEYEVIVRPNGERFVTFDKDRDWALPKDERFEIVPKPNWPLATGFEAKAAPGQKWSYGADDLELSDRTILKFEYEANGLARVTRIADGKVGTRHIYSGKILAGKGIVIPKVSRVLRSNGELVVSYEVQSADFSTPVASQELIEPWYERGVRIGDQRVAPAVQWTYEQLVRASGKREGLTPAELLRLSQQRAQVFAAEMARQETVAKSKATPTARWEVPILVFCLVFVGAMIVTILRNRLRRG